MTFLAFAENTIQLVPDGTLLFHIALILVMVYVLNRTLFKPVNRILAERERRTRGRSSEAGEILRRVDEELAQYERSLREARMEGYHYMEEQRAIVMAESEEQLRGVREELQHLIADEKESIKTQSEEARRSLIETARSMASQIGSQILRRPV